MLLPDGYSLMIPGFVDGEPNKVILYDVEAMLSLQGSDKLLAGHPSEDLPAFAWGTVAYPMRRVQR